MSLAKVAKHLATIHGVQIAEEIVTLIEERIAAHVSEAVQGIEARIEKRLNEQLPLLPATDDQPGSTKLP